MSFDRNGQDLPGDAPQLVEYGGLTIGLEVPLVSNASRHDEVRRNEAVQLAKRGPYAHTGAANDFIRIEAALGRPEQKSQDTPLRLGEQGFARIRYSSHIGYDSSLFENAIPPKQSFS